MKKKYFKKAWYVEEFDYIINDYTSIILLKFKSKIHRHKYYYHINRVFYGNKRIRFTMYRMNWIYENNILGGINISGRGPLVEMISDTIRVGFESNNCKKIKRGILSKVPHVFKF